jgi:serine/threonine protein kinase
MNIHILKELGRGTFGRVELIEDLNDGNQRKAMKTLLSTFENKYDADLLTEMYVLDNVKHPNILSAEKIKLNDGTEKSIFFDPITNDMKLFSNAMDGDCNDFFKIGNLLYASNEIVRQLVFETTKGLYQLHSRGFAHNDLKLQNILYKYDGSKYNFKIADFGMAKYLGIPHPIRAIIFRCTPWHKAPNSIEEPYYQAGNRYNYNSDMFSLGSCMYWLCNKKNRFPMYSNEYAQEIIDTKSRTFASRIPELKALYGENGFDFLMRCLESNSRHRISSKEALNHPFLSGLTRGGAMKLFDFITKTTREPTPVEYFEKTYELEYLEDMYKKYRDETVSIYVDISRHPELKYSMLSILNDWIYNAFTLTKYDVANLEFFVQYILYLVRFLNNSRGITRDNLQMYGLSNTFLPLETFFTYESTALVGFRELSYLTARTYTAKQFIESFDKILGSFHYKLGFCPLIFLVTYHYLHAIYEDHIGECKPNIEIFQTAIANLIVILLEHDNPKYTDISADHLAKWCVSNALITKGYTHSDYNPGGLIISPSLYNSFNDTIKVFKDKSFSDRIPFYVNLQSYIQPINLETEEIKHPKSKSKKVSFGDKYSKVKISAKYI